MHTSLTRKHVSDNQVDVVKSLQGQKLLLSVLGHFSRVNKKVVLLLGTCHLQFNFNSDHQIIRLFMILITHHTMKAHAETEAEHKFIHTAKHRYAQYNLKISGY
jgi:hypothetical protein